LVAKGKTTNLEKRGLPTRRFLKHNGVVHGKTVGGVKPVLVKRGARWTGRGKGGSVTREKTGGKNDCLQVRAEEMVKRPHRLSYVVFKKSKLRELRETLKTDS